MALLGLDAIRRPVAAELEAFEAFLSKQFDTEEGLLGEMLSHALTSRGKGVRPLLVMLCAGLHSEGRGGGTRANLAATLVEMIHLASLIHDDVIDESDLRRGRPSVNALWQSHKAVVLGDYLLARTMDIGLKSAQYDLVTLICGALTSLCEGELLQDADKSSRTRTQYFEIIRKKTASLLGVSAAAGALSVGAKDEVAAMQRFGEALGMAFQIQDDILDYLPSADTGKPSCNDLREGKITLPLIAVIEKGVSVPPLDSTPVETLQQLVLDNNGLDAARTTMQQYLQRALKILSSYPPSPYLSALSNLCVYVGERNK